ncbi:hypothetical protein D3C78_1330940 [compost metagenome]
MSRHQEQLTRLRIIILVADPYPAISLAYVIKLIIFRYGACLRPAARHLRLMRDEKLDLQRLKNIG